MRKTSRYHPFGFSANRCARGRTSRLDMSSASGAANCVTLFSRSTSVSEKRRGQKQHRASTDHQEGALRLARLLALTHSVAHAAACARPRRSHGAPCHALPQREQDDPAGLEPNEPALATSASRTRMTATDRLRRRITALRSEPASAGPCRVAAAQARVTREGDGLCCATRLRERLAAPRRSRSARLGIDKSLRSPLATRNQFTGDGFCR